MTQTQTDIVKYKQGTGKQTEVGRTQVSKQSGADLLEHNLNVHYEHEHVHIPSNSEITFQGIDD